MTGRDVPDADMQNFPEQQRAGGPGPADGALDALLVGAAPAGPEAAGLRPVADLLTALTAAPDREELSGHEAALAAFRQHRLERAGLEPAGARPPSSAGHRPRARRWPGALRARLAAAGGTAALLAGGFATAAYADVLPAPMQRFAHETIGAPPPHPGATGTPSPSASSGPAGSGGLVPATPARSQRPGSSPASAGGSQSGQSATGHGKSTAQPSPGAGKPTALPTSPPGGRGKPTALPTPSAKGRSKPTAAPSR